MTTDRARGRRSAGIAASAGGRLPVGRGGRRAGARPEAAVQRRETLTLVAMCLGVMMTFLLVTATISALSAIRDDLHVSPSALIWIPSAYMLVVASLVLGRQPGQPVGPQTDVLRRRGRHGRRRSPGRVRRHHRHGDRGTAGLGRRRCAHPARSASRARVTSATISGGSEPAKDQYLGFLLPRRQSGSRPVDHAGQLRSIGGRFVRCIVRRVVEVAVPAGQLTGYGFPRSPGSSCKGPIPICPQPTSLSDPGMRLLWPTGLGPGRWK